MNNMSVSDRVLRLIAAAVLTVLCYAGVLTGQYAMVAAIIAAIFAFSVLVNFCPMYRLFGISTCGNCDKACSKQGTCK